MRFVQVFCAAFFIFFCVGLYTGNQDRNAVTDEQSLLVSIAENFHIDPDTGAFSYKCNAHELFRYDITSNSIEPVSVDVLSAPETKIPSSLKGETILLLTSGLTVSQLATATRIGAGLTLKDRIAAVLGGLTGYSVGRSVMARKQPACDSSEVIRRLQRPEYGVEVGRQLVKKALTEQLVVINGEFLTQVSRLSALSPVLAGRQFKSYRPREPSPNRRILQHVNALLSIEQRLQKKDYTATSQDLSEAQLGTAEITSFLARNPDAIPGFQGATNRERLLRRIDGRFSFSWKELLSSPKELAFFVLWAFGAIVLVIILAFGMVFIYVTIRHVLTKKALPIESP